MSKTLAYYGMCRCCGQERKLYYPGSPNSLKIDMERGLEWVNESSYQKHLNCMHCFTKHGVSGSVKYQGKISPRDAYNALKIAKRGFYMDFDGMDEDVRNEKIIDQQLKNDEARVKEYMAWKSKKV